MNSKLGFACSALAICLLPGALSAATSEAGLREAALVTWVHGITPEIAAREIGLEGVPVLLELLRDPAFPRRDNVVAYLGQLGGDEVVSTLVELLTDRSISDERPEDRRSRLLVPDALGRIAARGGNLARAALTTLEVAAPDPSDASMQEMIEFGQRLASGTAPLADPMASADAPTNTTWLIDPSPQTHRLMLTYANHVDVDIPIDNARVDALLSSASTTFATEDDDREDTACCIQLRRQGTGGTWGVPGDGLDVISDGGELSDAMDDDTARIKVVDVIGHCGGPGANIIGCGNTPGNSIVVVRLSTAFLEGLLWGHEFGHNTGLGHSATGGFVMSPSLSSSNTKLSDEDCDTYHHPASQTQINPNAVGACHDIDLDEIVSSADNCPVTSNDNQANADADTFGNVCDNCPNVTNQSQVDCDADTTGDACDPSIDVPTQPIANVRFRFKDLLRWDPQPSYTKRIRRGELMAGDPWPFNQVEIATVPTDTLVEGFLPPVNGIFYYLVTAFNNCGESP